MSSYVTMTKAKVEPDAYLLDTPFLTQIQGQAFLFSAKQKITIIAICFSVIHFLALAHEGLGHVVLGCIAFGFKPLIFTSAAVQCSDETAPFGWVAASGTVMDLLFGFLFMALFTIYCRIVRRSEYGTTYYVLWVATILFLLHGGGYMMTSPLFQFGDWEFALRNVPRSMLWRIVVTVIGTIVSVFTFTFWAYPKIQPMIGDESSFKIHRAVYLVIVPYVVIALMQSAISAIIGPAIIVTTLLSSFGGAFLFGFVGILSIIHTKRNFEFSNAWIPSPPVTVQASMAWIVIGVLSVASHILFSFGIPWMSGPNEGWGHGKIVS